MFVQTYLQQVNDWLAVTVQAYCCVFAVHGTFKDMSIGNVTFNTHQPVALRVKVTANYIVGVSLQRSQAFTGDGIPQLQCFVI